MHISNILAQDLEMETSIVVTKEAQGTIYTNEFPIFI